MSKGRSVPSFCVDGSSSLRKGDARVSEFGFGNEGEGGSPSGFPFRIALHEEVASTNDEVKRALEAGEPEGLVVRALRQVSGYGRQGRSWTSPEGGLYCSLLLRPQVAPRELPTLSLVVGMAVRRALVALAGARAEEAVRIKWPNDVVLAQKARYARFPEATEIRDLGFSESGKELGQKIVHSGYFVPTKAMLAVRETAERLISRSFAASRSRRTAAACAWAWA